MSSLHQKYINMNCNKRLHKKQVKALHLGKWCIAYGSSSCLKMRAEEIDKTMFRTESLNFGSDYRYACLDAI